MNTQRLVKLSLRLFVASIAAAAIAGLYVIAFPGKDLDYELKILFTTVTVAGASMCGLACGSCMSRGRRVLPLTGLVLTSVSAVLILFGTWFAPTRGSVGDFWEVYWKVSAVAAFYAVACAHMSLLFMAKLTGCYRWAYIVAYFLVFGLATVLAAAMSFEMFENGDELLRLIGALSILVAAITLLVPIFHRLSRDEVALQRSNTDPLSAVEEELAQVKERLLELENKRQELLARSNHRDRTTG